MKILFQLAPLKRLLSDCHGGHFFKFSLLLLFFLHVTSLWSLSVSFPLLCHSVFPGVKPVPFLNHKLVSTGFQGSLLFCFFFLSLMESWDRVMWSCDDVTLHWEDLESVFLYQTRWWLFICSLNQQ